MAKSNTLTHKTTHLILLNKYIYLKIYNIHFMSQFFFTGCICTGSWNHWPVIEYSEHTSITNIFCKHSISWIILASQSETFLTCKLNKLYLRMYAKIWKLICWNKHQKGETVYFTSRNRRKKGEILQSWDESFKWRGPVALSNEGAFDKVLAKNLNHAITQSNIVLTLN